MTRTLPAILLLALTAADAAGQADGTVRIPGRFDRFTTDELGHVYALSGDELALYDMAGERLQRNSVKTFGRITAISAYYSLKPMVFSAGQGRIAVLDNTLSVQGSIMDLPRLGFAQVVQACMSVQNGFWFFDERELALARLDAQLRPLAHSGRLDQVLGFAPQPQGMLEHDGRLYVNDAHEGILVFDLFGDGLDQAIARRRGDHEVAADAEHGPHVEHDDSVAALRVGGPSRHQLPFGVDGIGHGWCLQGNAGSSW